MNPFEGPRIAQHYRRADGVEIVLFDPSVVDEVMANRGAMRRICIAPVGSGDNGH